VEDLIGPELPGELDLLRPADGSDMRAVRLRDLDRDAADPAGRTGDGDPLTRAQLRVIAQSLERHRARNGDPGRLLEAQPLGLRHELAYGANGVFGEGSTTRAEHRVSDRQIGYVRAHGFDDAGDVESPHLLTRARAPPPCLKSQEPSHHDVVRRIQRCRAYSHEHLIRSGARPIDLLDSKGLRASVPVLYNRPHRAHPLPLWTNVSLTSIVTAFVTVVSTTTLGGSNRSSAAARAGVARSTRRAGSTGDCSLGVGVTMRF